LEGNETGVHGWVSVSGVECMGGCGRCVIVFECVGRSHALVGSGFSFFGCRAARGRSERCGGDVVGWMVESCNFCIMFTS
jgi:hypothetical protein